MIEGNGFNRRRWICLASAATASCVAPQLARAGGAPFDGKRAGDRMLLAGIPLRWCPPGSFRMGAPVGEPDRRPDDAEVDVTLTGFWIGETSLTQGQWQGAGLGDLPGELSAGAG